MNEKPKILRSWRWESDFDPETFVSIGNVHVRKGMFWSAADQEDLDDLITKSHRLVVCIRAVCMNGSDSWEITSELRPAIAVKVPELEKLYFDLRKELLEDVQKRHIVDVGWIIQTYTQPKQIENDRWWRYAMGAASKERQELWRYYHNVVKYEDEKEVAA